MNEETTVIEPENALPQVSMADLPEGLRQAAARAGWTELMPVQAMAIPYLLAGRDLMVQSRTGSGKTGAFVLPILARIDLRGSLCQALVLVPTRELAHQVAGEAKLLAGDAGVKTVAVYGGVGYGPQIDAFRKGAQLVVGTPGRILDHLLKRSLTLENITTLIFDEADRMLSMGFYPDMRQVKRYLPARTYSSYMFSATYPPRVMRLAGEFLRNPDFLNLSSDHIHVSEVEHVYYDVPAMEKDRALVRIIEIENPSSALIFCNRRSRVHYVTVVLQRFGYDADELSADLAQTAREKVLERVRKGTLRFLVATDVAARGIDLPELSHVIQYEFPEDHEVYIHRAGRTGRAGGSGEAISLVSGGMELIELKAVAKRFAIDIQKRPLPSDEDVAAVVSERITALLEARLRARDKLQVERMARFASLAKSLSHSDDQTALLAMLLDDYYQETLHAPPDAPPEKSQAPRRTSRKRGKEKRTSRRRGRRRRR